MAGENNNLTSDRYEELVSVTANAPHSGMYLIAEKRRADGLMRYTALGVDGRIKSELIMHNGEVVN